MKHMNTTSYIAKLPEFESARLLGLRDGIPLGYVVSAVCYQAQVSVTG